MTKFLNISTDTTLGGNSPSDEVVSSQKAISAALATKQDTLVSGTNIKTVNNTSILGSGDITITSTVNWGYIGGTLADQTDLKDALDAKANDSSVVHLTTDETITGKKTFAGGQATIFKDNNNTIGTHSAFAWSTSDLYFTDSAGTRIARIQPGYVAGTNILQMGMYASNGTTTEQGIIVRSDGIATAPTPTTTTQASHTVIATTGWVNTVGNGVMHLSGAETANGNKTFTGTLTTTSSTPIHYFKSTNMDITSSGWASGRNTVAWCQDKNGHEAGGVYNYADAGGDAFTDMYVGNQKSGSTVLAHLRIWSGSTGATWATCPASDVNNSILTTVAKSKSSSGYFKLGNGMIVQWEVGVSLTNNTNHTLPTAFSSKNYVVCITDTSVTQACCAIVSSTTQFTPKLPTTSRTVSYIAIGY